MADPVLKRSEEESEEEREHRRLMSARMRALLTGEDVPETPARPVGAYEYPNNTLRSDRASAFSYAADEHHAPVVPNSPDAPSAANRLADYVPITVGMQSLQRFGDMPARSVMDYAAVESAPDAPSAEPAPAQKRAGLFETLLYKNGELLDTAAPETPVMQVEAPVYTPEITPSYAPAEPFFVPEPTYAPAPETSAEEDATPTARTMLHRKPEEETRTGLLAALSLRTKLVLAGVAAVILLLLAIVCVNTAVINSINSDVESRQGQLTQLTRQLNDINDEIERLTAPENVENWALEHGMNR